MSSKFSLFILLIFIQLSLYGADKPALQFERITSKEGLAHSSVTAITQDREGYMWIGTVGGLHRYDGNNFLVFNPEKNNPASISNSHIQTLLIDHENNLWIGTLGGGLNRYNRKQENFSQFINVPDDNSSLSSNDVYAICEDEEYNLWIGTYGGGLNLYNKDNGTFIRYDLGKEASSEQKTIWNSIRAMITLNDHEIMIGLDKGGIVVFDTKSRKVTRRYMNNPDDSSSVSDNTINTFFKNGNKIIVGTWYGGLNEFDINEKSFLRFMNNPQNPHSVSSNIVVSLCVDQRGGLWAGTWNKGLNYRPPGESRFYDFTNDREDAASITANAVLAIYEDRQGIIWIGTRAGLNKIQPYRNEFNHIHHHPKIENSLSGNNVRAFAEDKKGNIWIGTRGEGLNKLEVSSGKITKIIHHLNDHKSLPNNAILSLYADEDFLWIGTEGSGLIRMNTITNKFEDFSKYFNERSNAVFDIDKDEEGNIWFSTWGDGVNSFNPVTKAVKNYPIDELELNSNAVISLLVEKDTVWVGSFERGLIRINRKTGEKIYYKNNDNKQISRQWSVHYIFRASGGNLWIGTESGGLISFNTNNGTFKAYTKEDGLINNIVNGIEEDNNRNLWLTTYGGISKFDPQKEQFTNFDNQDGLQNEFFDLGTILKSQSGMLFTGGSNGITCFYPDSIKVTPYNLPVLLTGLNIYNKRITEASNKYNPATPQSPSEIFLNYNDRIISFEFNVFDYLNRDKIKYAHMLEGVDIEWVYTEFNQQFASYSNLSPGEYNFYVKATNNYGEWSKEYLIAKVNVKPAYWQTILFKIIIILFIITLIVLFIKSREKEQIKQQKQLEEKVARRTYELRLQKELVEFKNKELERSNATKNKFFQIIAHDLKNPIGGIYSLSELLYTEYTNLKESEIIRFLSTMKSSSEKVLTLLNNLLDWARTQTNRIDLNQADFNLVEVIDSTIIALAPVVEKKQIKIKSQYNNSLFVFADRYMIRTVVHNILSNAIKFTHPNGNIAISVNKINGSVQVSIVDDGTGIPEKIRNSIFRIDEMTTTPGTSKESGTGLGLLLCKEFVEINGGKIWFESTFGKGTAFYFTIQESKEIHE